MSGAPRASSSSTSAEASPATPCASRRVWCPEWAVEEVDQRGRGVRLDPHREPWAVGRLGGARPEEARLEHPAPGVDQLGSRVSPPLRLIVGGERAGSVGVPEDDVGGRDLEPIHHLSEGAQRGAPQLGARYVSAERAQARAVQGGDDEREGRAQGQAPDPAATPAAGQGTPGLRRCTVRAPARSGPPRSAMAAIQRVDRGQDRLVVLGALAGPAGGSWTTLAITPAPSRSNIGTVVCRSQ